MNLDFIIILFYTFLISGLTYQFDQIKKNTISNLEKITLGDTCKDYLMYLQAYTRVSIFSMMTGIVSSFVMYIIMKLSRQMMNMQNDQIYLISFLTWLVTFTASYKFFNCMLNGAICPGDCGILNLDSNNSTKNGALSGR